MKEAPIPEYKIIRANSGDELEASVNAALQEGWIPVGGIAIYTFDPHDASLRYCAQAITRNVRIAVQSQNRKEK